MDTDHAFEKFDKELQLDPRERLKAIKLHNEITLILVAAGLITGAFLQGSFRRKTMRSPLHDVDKVLILRKELFGMSPQQVMARIELALRPHFEGIMFEHTRHSLKLHLPGCLFSFDAVPAFEIEEPSDDVLIANTETGGWERSNTRELIRTVQDRNQLTNGQFVLYVREVKHFVGNQLGDKFPGLHTESLAYLAVDEPLNHANACLRIFETAAQMLGGSYFDPTGVDRISDRLDAGVAIHARKVFLDAAGKACKAIEASAEGDHSAGIAIWHSLFGEPFQRPRTPNAEDAIVAAFAGAAVDTAGRVRQSSRLTQHAAPTRAWCH